MDGNDINQGNRKLTLALIWQLRRHSLLMMLSALRERSAGPITDEVILRWANEAVAASGSSRKLSTFGDASLGDSLSAWPKRPPWHSALARLLRLLSGRVWRLWAARHSPTGRGQPNGRLYSHCLG